MRENILKNELKSAGYSKEEQYFYDLNLRLKKNHVLLPKEDSLTKDNRLKECAIQRWETDGGCARRSQE